MKRNRARKRANRTETQGFWERGLSNADIVPVSEFERTLGGWRSAVLWLATGATISWYGVGAAAVSAWGALGFLSVFALFALLAGQLAGRLTRASAPHGVGLLGLLRAAFGPRGATPFLCLWPLILAFWLAQQAISTATWIERLISRYQSEADVPPWAAFLNERLPEAGPSVLTLVLTVALLLLTVVVAAGGLARVGRTAVVGLVLVGASSLPLFVFVFVFLAETEKPLTPLLTDLDFSRGNPFGVADGIRLLAWAPFAIVPLLAATDWCRFRFGPRRENPSWSAMLAFPTAMGFMALVGTVFGVAATASLGSSNLHPIADTAAFGGLRVAAAGILLSMGLWLLAPPLIGLYSQAQGWAAAWPRLFSYRSGVVLATLGTAGAVTMLWYQHLWLPALTPSIVSVADMPLLLWPVLTIVIADEFILRRHHLRTADLYRSNSQYAGILGTTWTAVGCAAAGIIFHPWFLPLWSERAGDPLAKLSGMLPEAVRPWLGDPHVVVFVAALVAALFFLLTAPIERAIVRGLRRGVQRGSRGTAAALRSYREKRKEAREEPRFVPISDDKVFGSTNPNFEYHDPK